MDPRSHPFAGKLSPGQAEEVRRLRARGLSLAELAGRFGIARSSISAIVKYNAQRSRDFVRLVLHDRRD